MWFGNRAPTSAETVPKVRKCNVVLFVVGDEDALQIGCQKELLIVTGIVAARLVRGPCLMSLRTEERR